MWHRQQEIRRNAQTWYREKKLVKNRFEKRAQQYDPGLGAEKRSGLYVSAPLQNKSKAKDKRVGVRLSLLLCNYRQNHNCQCTNAKVGNYDPQAKLAYDLFSMECFFVSFKRL